MMDIKVEPSGHTRVQWILAVLVNSTLMMYGFEAGWMSPMTRVLQSEQSPIGAALTDSTVSLVASILCMSATISVPFYSYVADVYGRKPAVIVVATLQAMSWMIKLSLPTTVGLVLARVLAGLGAGGSFSVVPMYVKEISQDDIRGLLGSLMIMSQNVGIFIIYLIGVYLDYFTILWIMCPLPLVIALLMIKAPESPPFLVTKGKIEEATKTVALLRGRKVDCEVVQKEIEIMKNQELYFQSLPKFTFVDVYKNKVWRRIFIIMLMILSVHATNGSFAIINYGTSTLASSGIQYSISPELQALSFPIVMIIGSSVSMSCVEMFGRKPLLCSCLLLSVCSMGSLACAMLLQSHGISPPAWLPVTAMVGSVFVYAAGVSPVPYIIMSEVFNFQIFKVPYVFTGTADYRSSLWATKIAGSGSHVGIRAKMMGLLVTYAWFMTFVQLYLYEPISSALGQYSIFFCFAGINLFGFIITIILLPETKSKSVEEIEATFKKK